MGFVSYSRAYLQYKLNEYEAVYNNGAPDAIVHEAKVLLKMLEDIYDEGYTYAYNAFSSEFDCIDRLRAFIIRNDDEPFEMVNYTQLRDIRYSDKKHELTGYLSVLEGVMRSSGPSLPETSELFYDILDYTKSIYDSAAPDTAYVFLLRDALLPYLAFKAWDKDKRLAAYPLLIGRKYLSLFRSQGDTDGDEDLYDAVHASIFSALTEEPENFGRFREAARSHMLEALKLYPKALASLKSLLDSIPEKKILVVETGYIGSVPMLLSCLDDRVDFRLFTTVPYFYKTYGGKYFTDAFEKIRLFETVQCQDALFRLSSLEGGKFLISETDSEVIKDRAAMELRTWMRLISREC